MKTVFPALALSLFSLAAAAQSRPAPDTIVVRLPNKVVMTLQVRNAQQLRQLPQYHLDSLVARLGTYIERAEAAARVANTERSTINFHPNQDQPGQGLPEEIRVTTYQAAPDAPDRRSRMEVLLDKKFNVQVSGNHSRDRHLTIGRSNPAYRDSLRDARHTRKSSANYLTVDVGLNALVNRGTYTLPGGQPGRLELRPEGSRYFNIGLDHRQRLGGKHSPLSLLVGPEVAFNNYMLEGNYKWQDRNGRTDVVLETNGRQYSKTKLATSTLTLPLMLQLGLRDRHYHRTLTLGAGGFVGYRLGSWTKLKYYEDGSTRKDKDYGAYNLNDWQYGLQGTLGYGFFTFFAKYNLNPLFRAGQGPEAQTLTFGVRILGFK